MTQRQFGCLAILLVLALLVLVPATVLMGACLPTLTPLPSATVTARPPSPSAIRPPPTATARPTVNHSLS